MAGLYDWFAAAMLAPAGPAATIALIPIAARTHRTTPRMASDSFEITTVQFDGRGAMTIRCAVRLSNSIKDQSRFGYSEGIDRVEALGGKMTIHSQPGSGTALLVNIPIEAD
jgi:signal transduction histidine kinase